jgi:hypothetical protein
MADGIFDKVKMFSETLLLLALDHHERYWTNGNHDMSNCELCALLIRISVETNTSIKDLKLHCAAASKLAS